MSNVYTLEPPTKGKVCLTTTLGDVEVELWPKEAPLACRNFVQLCLEGFYLKTAFHRIVPKFMIQAGDETGTGTGGVSIYGSHFKDEFHSRLRFTHRGLVACANQNAPDTNNSQFFITLGRCEDLDKRYTIFGKVAGDTIFNVVRISEVPVDSRNHPLEPVGFTACEVLWNPFDDIVPRTAPTPPLVRLPRAQPATQRGAVTQERVVEEAPRKKEKKNLTLLSFGDDEEETESVPMKRKIKSAHEALQDERLIQEDEESRKRREAQEEKLRKDRVTSVRQALKKPTAIAENQPSRTTMEDKLKEKIQSENLRAKETEAVVSGSPRQELATLTPFSAAKAEEEEESEEKKEVLPDMGYDRLYIKRKKAAETAEDLSLLDEAERTRARLKQRKKLYGDREKATLDRLANFQQTLKSKKKQTPTVVKQTETSVNVELPAAWRVGDYLKDAESIGVNDLLSHRLEFDHAKKDSMSRDMHALQDYIVIDSRLEKAGSEAEPSEKWVGKPNV